MITTINLTCPHCDQESQIILTSAVSVIILNCPDCRSPIMYFRKKIFLLDQGQLEKITGTPSGSEVFQVLEQVAANSPDYCPLDNRHRFKVDHYSQRSITGDDCTNLRIELELCRDAKAFIDRL